MKKLFSRIFKKRQVVNHDEDITMPLPKIDLGGETLPAVSKKYHPDQFILGTAQSVGRQRNHNEDALFSMNTIMVEAENEYPFGIFVVADGMGGHESGEVASGETVRVLAEYMINNLYIPLIKDDGSGPIPKVDAILIGAVEEVQKVVSEKVPGGGTTLTAAVILGKDITIAHVGDSRAYFINPNGSFEIITHDHSLVQRLQDLGQITEEDALVHPQRNVLYRAIGQADPLTPDISTRKIQGPGYLLLCSDGLWGVVPKQELIQTVLNEACPSDVCAKLVNAANERGGPDNITAVLIQFL